MVQELINWLLQIPQACAEMGKFLTSPIYSPYINQTPLELLSVSGIAVIITIIGVHVVKLFIGD